MNLLSLIPESYRGVVNLVMSQVPIVKCAIDGHEPVANVSIPLTTEGVTRSGRLCLRCKLVYWELK